MMTPKGAVVFLRNLSGQRSHEISDCIDRNRVSIAQTIFTLRAVSLDQEPEALNQKFEKLYEKAGEKWGE